ncbi:MAG: nucleoside triphosphate pyrophosphohydrolase [Geminicoccaceae bacterium]|nr:MAG: nucleoside triphosphate pyrophosphohydrolase [Geminicoccaceae bacterium]
MSEDPRDRSRPGIERLLEVMRRLRDPGKGCPWDKEQTFATIAPYTIEEAYEVADAIRREAWEELRGELGDLLLQVVYHAQMAREAGLFDFDAVAHGIADKMIRRHPHVFGDAVVESAAAQRQAWEEVKAAERAREVADPSVLAGLPLALPALTRAEKLQRRAARIGFDWPEPAPILSKIEEELDEVRASLAAREPKEKLAEELGDLLFAVVNLARRLEVDAEEALRAANAKFERRFRAVEERARAAGSDPASLGLEALDRLWEEVKAGERDGSGSGGA